MRDEGEHWTCVIYRGLVIASDPSLSRVLLVNPWTIAHDLGVEALGGEDGESVGAKPMTHGTAGSWSVPGPGCQR
jgi:hypothetical protein